MEVALNYFVKNNKNVVAKILYNLLNNYDNAEGVYLKDESLFIGRALDPFVNAVFPTGGTMTKDGHFTYLIGNSELKPDVKFSARTGSNVFDFLIFEVKCPNSIAKVDLFKMSLELQFMINRMIENNVNSPVVYGVVGKGFDYDVYKMELVAPFVYLMVKVRTFYLPRSTFDFNVTLTTIPALLQLQQLSHTHNNTRLTAASTAQSPLQQYPPYCSFNSSVTLTTIPALLQLQQLSQNQVNKARSSIMSAENEQHRWTRSPLISLKNTL